MPDRHAKLTCSGADRWMHCTPSVRLQEPFPDTGSEAAGEGTRAHALAEAKLTGAAVLPPADDGEMDESTDAYRDYVLGVLEEMKAAGEYPQLFVEVQLDVSPWVPEGFGTADAVIVGLGTLQVIDFKYGKGVTVDAKENAQMRLYALGAVDRFWDTTEFSKVKMHIFQPRKDNYPTEEMTVKELLAWGDMIKPLADKAFKGEGEPCAGSWCRWCRCAHQCKAYAKKMFGPLCDRRDPALMGPDEIAGYLTKLDDSIKWANGLKNWALTKALEGESFPGFKLVEGRSARKITDPEGFAQQAVRDGYPEEKVWKPKELQTLTNLEKLIGEKKVAADYGPYITKPRGKPALVPSSDPRPTYNDLQNLLEEEKEKN